MSIIKFIGYACILILIMAGVEMIAKAGHPWWALFLVLGSWCYDVKE